MQLDNLTANLRGKCTTLIGDVEDIKCLIYYVNNGDIKDENMQSLDRILISLNCHIDHKFHLKCISTWFINHNTCIFCNHLF